jgi:hypothetical protein
LGRKHLEERTGGALDRCIVVPVPRAADHTRASIPPVPVHAHGANRARTALLSRYVTACGRLASKYWQVSARTASSPFNQRSLPRPSTRDVLLIPDTACAMSDARRQRCPPSSIHPSSAGSLPHLSCLSAHDARQALQAAGSARRTTGPHLHPAAVTVARHAREISYSVQPRRPLCPLRQRTR